jgi:hypothetical protein
MTRRNLREQLTRTQQMLTYEAVARWAADPRPDVQFLWRCLRIKMNSGREDVRSVNLQIRLTKNLISRHGERNRKLSERIRELHNRIADQAFADAIAQQNGWRLSQPGRFHSNRFVFEERGIVRFQCQAGKKLSKEAVYDLVAAEAKMDRRNIKQIALTCPRKRRTGRPR